MILSPMKPIDICQAIYTFTYLIRRQSLYKHVRTFPALFLHCYNTDCERNLLRSSIYIERRVKILIWTNAHNYTLIIKRKVVKLIRI